MKIAVIGATGTVAQGTIHALEKAGHTLKLFSRGISAEKYPNHETIRGDVFNEKDLEKVVKGCDAIHITIGRVDEAAAMQSIVSAAEKNNIQLISYVSGASVSKENSWFPMIAAKYEAENTLKNSGIPFVIFRPTFFMEALPMMIQGKRASVLGQQPNPLSFLAAGDFGELLVAAYEKPEAQNQTFYAYGPEAMPLKKGLEMYVAKKYPEIKKVSNTPYWLLSTIAFFTGNKELKEVVAIFKYFENVTETGSPNLSNKLLGKPQTTLAQWLA